MTWDFDIHKIILSRAEKMRKIISKIVDEAISTDCWIKLEIEKYWNVAWWILKKMAEKCEGDVCRHSYMNAFKCVKYSSQKRLQELKMVKL